MQIKIEKEVFRNFPQTEIGIIIADVEVNCHRKEKQKILLLDFLKKHNITINNYRNHPNLRYWQAIYKNHFKVKLNKYHSSIESLVARILKNQSIWQINNIVDLYNLHSIKSLLPIGGYDYEKINGNINLRYSIGNEIFYPLNTEKNILVEKSHIVYSDEKIILCWLWNYNDSKYSAISNTTTKAIFFIDNFTDNKFSNIDNIIENFCQDLKLEGSIIRDCRIINSNNPIHVF